MSKKALVALSGGVDSAAAALLLAREGYEVAGAVMKMSPAHEPTVEAARRAASQLGIRLFELDLTERFKTLIIDNFVDEYLRGRTPNPCVRCNPSVKFFALTECAQAQGYDKIATGHYARVVKRGDRFFIAQADCAARDQSYMLYRLGQEVLGRLLLPLCGIEKSEARRLAREAGLDCHSAPDSSENCFLPDNDYKGFLRSVAGELPGEIISPEGEVCGRHGGIYNFTVGQRKGLGSFGKPVFVKSIDAASNRVYLGYGGEEFFPSAEAEDCLFYLPGDSFECSVKIRSAAKPAQARVTRDGTKAHIEFSSPQRAVAPGQSAVFYSDGLVTGGGVLA